MFDTKLEFLMNNVYTENKYIKNHEHPCYELIYYIDGTGKSIIDGIEFDYSKDTFAIIHPYQIHNETNYTQTEVLYIGFTIMNNRLEIKSGVYNDVDKLFLPILLKMKKEMEEKSVDYKRILNILVEEIAIYLSRIVSHDKVPDIKMEGFENALKYIGLNFMRNINIYDIAKEVGYSYDYFRHMFKKQMNTTVKKYIIEMRLNHAKRLLAQHIYSKTEVAEMCGFYSLSHFNSAFKQHFGISPDAYVKKTKENLAYNELMNYNLKNDKQK